MESDCYWKLKLVIFLAVNGALTFSGNSAFTQVNSQIVPDNTLGTERSIVTPDVRDGIPIDRIDGGAKQGINLFHSFEEFNVDAGKGVYFQNQAGIENILSRVTGNNPSGIFGKLGVLEGNANLFLINPQGIIFGSGGSLDVGGSFVATTANSIQFGNQGFFSASVPNIPPTLMVNPSALLFNQIAVNDITNNSRVTSNTTSGLGVPKDRSLLLVGGDVNFDNGVLDALGGRVELGGLAGEGTISLNVSGNNLNLSYPQGVQLANISFTNASLVRGRGSNVHLQAGRVKLTKGSQILSFPEANSVGNLTVNASESVELIGEDSSLSSFTFSAGDAGDTIINTRRLLLEDRAFIATDSIFFIENSNEPSEQRSIATGQAGDLTVNASESVKLKDGSLSSQTLGSGDAGNITLNTAKLLLSNGANVSTSTFGDGQAGKLVVNASDSVELSDESSVSSTSETFAAGSARDIKIKTGRLTVRDGAEVSVSSAGTGNAGNLEVTADSIRLDNEGKIIATSESGEGGDIRLQDLDLLLLRDNSEISTTSRGTKRGGDIKINADTLIGLENSDITANAFDGEGGFIQITAQGIFGLEVNETDTISELRNNNTSDISAASQKDPSLNGRVEINRPEAEPSSGLVTLPAELVDISRLIAQGCAAGGGNVARGASQFVATGRGGLPPTPTEALRSDTALADLGTPIQGQDRASAASPNLTASQPTPLVEAQGWVIGSKGEVVLTAQAPTVTRIPWLTPTSCNAS